MKRRLIMALSVLLALVMGLSLVGCQDANKPDPSEKPAAMTQEKWEAAFDKSASFANRTETTKMEVSMSLAYNGAPVEADTDLGGGLKGETLLEGMKGMLMTMSTEEVHLIDADNGKVNVVSHAVQGTSKNDEKEFYRLNGAKIERTETYEDDDPDKTVYGPYADEATAKKVLLGITSIKNEISNSTLTDKEGKPFNIVKNFDKLTYKNGVYTAEVGMDMDMPVLLTGVGTVKITDDYVSSLKMNIDSSVSFGDIQEGMPEGLTLEVSLVGELSVTDIGKTVVTDDGLEEVDEDDIDEVPVIASKEEFEALFRSVEDGVSFSVSDDDYYYTVEVKQTEEGYDSIVFKNSYENNDSTYTYYIVTENGIDEYEGIYEDNYFTGWKEPEKVSSSGTLDALLALLPSQVNYYFATYNDGKTIPELFSEFNYYDLEYLIADLTGKDKNVSVRVSYYYDSYYESFTLSSLRFDNKDSLSVSGAYMIDGYNPRTFEQN
ncbi:MAG: hypothetical protein J1F33_01680 [Clostridiales bacterium]|nr:hypothetical protein [Clostridiales bacterium]